MKTLMLILLAFSALSSAASNNLLLLPKNKFNFTHQNQLSAEFNSFAPKKKSKAVQKAADIPFLISGGMVVVGGALAILYGYNHKDNSKIAVTGGVIALTGGMLATIRVFSLTKRRGHAKLKDIGIPNTSLALYPTGLHITHRF